MFSYSDPIGKGILTQRGALQEYQAIMHAFYREFAHLAGSAFTVLEAFDQVQSAQESTVEWVAFPKLAQAPSDEIDSRRFRLQDEYVEWHVEREGGRVRRITFTTEFPEYYEALARIGPDALISGIQDALPGSSPTLAELFGPNFDPEAATPDKRAFRFRNQLIANPWNNGQKDILALSHPNNTMGALFNLAGNCAILSNAQGADAICAGAHGSCVPGRNSDPFICNAVQSITRGNGALSVQDPAGVKIQRLRGIWKLDGNAIDINDPTNSDIWKISRNGRRATLDLSKNVTIVDDPISSGAQVSTALEVSVTVMSAPEADLPAWAQTGQESSRRIS